MGKAWTNGMWRSSGGSAFLGDPLPNDGRDPRAEKLDRLHQLVVRYRSDRHLKHEAVVSEDVVHGNDLSGEGFRIADEKRTVGAAGLIELRPTGRPPAALPADPV